jgi:hypothetical protein
VVQIIVVQMTLHCLVPVLKYVDFFAFFYLFHHRLGKRFVFLSTDFPAMFHVNNTFSILLKVKMAPCCIILSPEVLQPFVDAIFFKTFDGPPLVVCRVCSINGKK